jgi:hypothetical protein
MASSSPLPRSTANIPLPEADEVVCGVCSYPVPADMVERVETGLPKTIYRHPGRVFPCAKYDTGATVEAKKAAG